jgi:circadian clock protein KaiB
MINSSQNHSQPPKQGGQPKFLLFVAGNEPNSMLARQNLEAFCQTEFKNGYEVQIVDVFEDHRLALQHRILVTPCLIMLEPSPSVIIAGTLQDKQKVRTALRVSKD